MSEIPVRLVLYISGIISDSEGHTHMMLLFRLQMLWFEVALATVISCLEVSLLLIFTGYSVSKTVLLQLLSISESTQISLLLETLFIHCVSSTLYFQDSLIGVQVPTKWLS